MGKVTVRKSQRDLTHRTVAPGCLTSHASCLCSFIAFKHHLNFIWFNPGAKYIRKPWGAAIEEGSIAFLVPLYSQLPRSFLRYLPPQFVVSTGVEMRTKIAEQNSYSVCKRAKKKKKKNCIFKQARFLKAE